MAIGNWQQTIDNKQLVIGQTKVWSFWRVEFLDSVECHDSIWIIASALVPFWDSLWDLSYSLRFFTILYVRSGTRAWQYIWRQYAHLYLYEWNENILKSKHLPWTVTSCRIRKYKYFMDNSWNVDFTLVEVFEGNKPIYLFHWEEWLKLKI